MCQLIHAHVTRNTHTQHAQATRTRTRNTHTQHAHAHAHAAHARTRKRGTKGIYAHLCINTACYAFPIVMFRTRSKEQA